MISRMRPPNCPATMTTTRSSGSITETAEDSSAVRPEPGMTMISPFTVRKTRRSARVRGSRICTSKCWSYWIIGGWLMACRTGHGNSVGPGIMIVARVCGTPERMVGSIAQAPLVRRRGASAPDGRGGQPPVGPADSAVGAPPRPTVGEVSPRLDQLIRRRGASAPDGRGGQPPVGRVDLDWSGAGFGQPPLLAPDQVEIAAVDEEPRRLAEDEDWIQAIDGIDQEREPTADGEEPERDRDDALLPPLGRDPLDQKAHREECLSQEAHRQPEVLRADHGQPFPGARHAARRGRHGAVPEFHRFTLPETTGGLQGVSWEARSVGPALMDQVWREISDHEARLKVLRVSRAGNLRGARPGPRSDLRVH